MSSANLNEFHGNVHVLCSCDISSLIMTVIRISVWQEEVSKRLWSEAAGRETLRPRKIAWRRRSVDRGVPSTQTVSDEGSPKNLRIFQSRWSQEIWYLLDILYNLVQAGRHNVNRSVTYLCHVFTTSQAFFHTTYVWELIYNVQYLGVAVLVIIHSDSVQSWWYTDYRVTCWFRFTELGILQVHWQSARDQAH